MMTPLRYVLNEEDFNRLIRGGTISVNPVRAGANSSENLELRLADIGWQRMATLLARAMGESASTRLTEEESLAQRAQDAYRDDHFPERSCDYCMSLYRGPAVYCSLSCATLDT